MVWLFCRREQSLPEGADVKVETLELAPQSDPFLAAVRKTAKSQTALAQRLRPQPRPLRQRRTPGSRERHGTTKALLKARWAPPFPSNKRTGWLTSQPLAASSSSRSGKPQTHADRRAARRAASSKSAGTGSRKMSELPKTQGELVGKLCDETVGNALATMLGGISVKKPKMNSLLPAGPDCVEVGPTPRHWRDSSAEF